MIADLKPYPEYMESGLPWLGKVPEHWDVVRIKTVLRESDIRSTDGTGTLLSLTRNRGLIPHSEMTYKQHSAKTLIGYKCYKSGQIVMNRMQAWSGMFGSGAVCGLVSPDYAVFDILGGHVEKFILERLKTQDLVGQFAFESKGIGSGFNRLYTDRFGPIPISLPPPDEQAAIVRFLGWANGQLEKAIRAKRKVITLLNEQKQVIIHRAVTRGLDLSVPLKPSGIPWLGDIPEHWEKSRLKIIASNVTEQTSFMSEVDVYVALENVESWSGKVTFQRKQDGDLFTGQVKKFQKNDVLFGKLRPYLAKAFTALVSGVCVGEFFVLRTNSFLCSKFLEHVLHTKAVIDVINSSTFGAKMPRVDWQFMGNLQIPVPPISEQKDIIQKIDIDTLPLHVAISRFEREIELLREYRTRLVADVVTGKLDVREAAAKLPDETMSDLSDNDSVEALEDEPFEEEALV